MLIFAFFTHYVLLRFSETWASALSNTWAMISRSASKTLREIRTGLASFFLCTEQHGLGQTNCWHLANLAVECDFHCAQLLIVRLTTTMAVYAKTSDCWTMLLLFFQISHQFFCIPFQLLNLVNFTCDFQKYVFKIIQLLEYFVRVNFFNCWTN